MSSLSAQRHRSSWCPVGTGCEVSEELAVYLPTHFTPFHKHLGCVCSSRSSL